MANERVMEALNRQMMPSCWGGELPQALQREDRQMATGWWSWRGGSEAAVPLVGLYFPVGRRGRVGSAA